jgi:hypothetical protein
VIINGIKKTMTMTMMTNCKNQKIIVRVRSQ